ncbi:unnamed protein product [Amoebophrya sp. A25]|nr:unnamed protein product [Amoebophrya sp. A25]|eukprot:GSA25T00027573001.1
MGNFVVRLDVKEKERDHLPNVEAKQTLASEVSDASTGENRKAACDEMKDVGGVEATTTTTPEPEERKAVSVPNKVSRMMASLVQSEPRSLRRQLHQLGVAVPDSEKSRSRLAVMICVRQHGDDRDLVRGACVEELQRLTSEIAGDGADLLALGQEIGAVASWIVHLA